MKELINCWFNFHLQSKSLDNYLLNVKLFSLLILIFKKFHTFFKQIETLFYAFWGKLNEIVKNELNATES